ncbi:MAG: hypothetical protein HW387_98 [Parachlamydiales bacterium]|nr:hypothetical protein [Parachlamydiales bacterium]
MMDSKIILRSFGTHDGSFHADEVTACSLLLLFKKIDADKIFRTRRSAILAQCEYVCDVGGEYNPMKKRFDHHQSGYRGSLSSAGMVLQYLKESGCIEPSLYDYFNEVLIMGVDAHDIGVAKVEIGTSSFSQVVSNFMPIEYEASDEEMLKAFWRAVGFVVEYLDRLRQRHDYILKCKAIVREKMNAGGNVLIFDAPIPWMENFFEMNGDVHPAEFVIMPAGPHWKLRGIPPNMADRMKVRHPLPEKWAGLHDEDLQKVSGIEGAVFCHKGRFISIWKTREDAIKAFHLAMEKK